VVNLFRIRLKELRQMKKLKQTELAEILNITYRAVQNYEAGDREPNIDKLIFLADYFNVSLDYLVGRSDKPERK
jgi:transcriptional regulator with XRE-family HTH domain